MLPWQHSDAPPTLHHSCTLRYGTVHNGKLGPEDMFLLERCPHFRCAFHSTVIVLAAMILLREKQAMSQLSWIQQPVYPVWRTRMSNSSYWRRTVTLESLTHSMACVPASPPSRRRGCTSMNKRESGRSH